jgi:hypothetical protein
MYAIIPDFSNVPIRAGYLQLFIVLLTYMTLKLFGRKIQNQSHKSVQHASSIFCRAVSAFWRETLFLHN